MITSSHALRKISNVNEIGVRKSVKSNTDMFENNIRSSIDSVRLGSVDPECRRRASSMTGQAMRPIVKKNLGAKFLASSVKAPSEERKSVGARRSVNS